MFLGPLASHLIRLTTSLVADHSVVRGCFAVITPASIVGIPPY